MRLLDALSLIHILASVAGMVVGGLVPLTVFFNKKSLLHFEKPVWRGREFLKALGNGSSEMVSNLASAITTTLFNLQMMALVGEKGCLLYTSRTSDTRGRNGSELRRSESCEACAIGAGQIRRVMDCLLYTSFDAREKIVS